MSGTQDFTTLMEQARRPEASVLICMRGDLAADHEAAERELIDVKDRRDDSKEGAGVGALVERIEALEAEMRAHSHAFRLQALPRHEFRELLNAHPPRRGDDDEVIRDDAAYGINRETFYPALVRACCVDPVLEDSAWAKLLDHLLTDAQFQELAVNAWNLNAGKIDIPFSRAASFVKTGFASE